MRIYTETQLERAIDLAKRNVSKNSILESLTPIELPSAEEIDKNGYHSEEYNEVWIGGANYVLNKIKEGNNEQQ
jgi:hypothetical protein